MGKLADEAGCLEQETPGQGETALLALHQLAQRVRAQRSLAWARHSI